MEPDLEPVWGLVANVVDERFYGAEGATRSGTKHFVAGAKVFYHRAFWGMAAEQVTVTGHHRGSKKLVTVVMARRHLHNWRAQLIYKPSILRRFNADWYELADSRDGRDPETKARERADEFNHAHNFSTYDRTQEAADGLIKTWRLDGFEDLGHVEAFDGDRWVILYDHLTPVGIGVSDFSREYELWIKPGYGNGRTKLKETLQWGLPETADAPRLEYETGMSSATLQELAELMAEQFDRLHAAVFDANLPTPGVDHLTPFVLPLLRSSFIDWPVALSGHEAEVLAGWLDGRPAADVANELRVGRMQVADGFEHLRTTGYRLAGVSVRLMRTVREYDVDEKKLISDVLEHNRLQTGVNSALAESLVRRIHAPHFGLVRFSRVAASALANEYGSRRGTNDQQQFTQFTQFALDRAEDWVDRGLFQPLDPLTDRDNWGSQPSRFKPALVAYHIENCPE